MKRKAWGKYFFVCCLVAVLLPSAVLAFEPPDPSTYLISRAEYVKSKAFFDDPRPMLTTIGPYQILPKELIDHLTYGVEKMKDLWAEVVGFRSPDLVGKIAPEIKPGKYTYKDLEKYPGFKELMWPLTYQEIRAAGPPFAGAVEEFEVIPTQQYYWALPVAEATKRNLGKTKQTEDGYLVPGTHIAGFPFPRPSGPHKGIQIMYNWEKRYLAWGANFFHYGQGFAYDKNLKIDSKADLDVKMCRFASRTLLPPYGFLDKRAQLRNELKGMSFTYVAPRDAAGMTYQAIYFEPYDKMDQIMLYIPSFRRIRKMTATDTQDPFAGADGIYDDGEGFIQKLSPTRYPYEYTVLDEREFLVNARVIDGSEHIESKGKSFVGAKLERRPCYVLELKQLDPNYIYGKRVFLMDKETFLFYHVDNYDQEGLLYRNGDLNYSWWPKMGMWSWCGGFLFMRDHIDTHSTIQMTWQMPAFWTRRDLSLKGMLERAK